VLGKRQCPILIFTIAWSPWSVAYARSAIFMSFIRHSHNWPNITITAEAQNWVQRTCTPRIQQTPYPQPKLPVDAHTMRCRLAFRLLCILHFFCMTWAQLYSKIPVAQTCGERHWLTCAPLTVAASSSFGCHAVTQPWGPPNRPLSHA
jgi:hypothetical protein